MRVAGGVSSGGVMKMRPTDPESVARIEAAECNSFLSLYRAAAAACGTDWATIDGISAVWSRHDDDPGYSCILNLDAAEHPSTALAALEAEARQRGIALIGIDAPPAVLERISDDELKAQGYVAEYEECMWGRVVSETTLPEHSTPDGVVIQRVSPAESDTFARVLNIGYDLPADAMRGFIFASTLGMPNWSHYLVTFDGVPGSASVLYTTGRVANLFVATTIPRFRGRGAQGALIRRRLFDAFEAGCDLATSQTVVDNASPRNMARHGFQPLYDRWIYGKTL
jgi:hypothetical protein